MKDARILPEDAEVRDLKPAAPASAEQGPASRREPAPDPDTDAREGVAAPGWKVFLGKWVLRVCPSGREECKNPHCRLRPFCACARAAFEAGRKTEARVWITVALCGGIVILLALLWSLMARK